MISGETVEHIARLARIELTDDEKKRFEKELDAILDYVRQLDEVDTEGLLPMTGGTREDTVMRSDVVVSDVLEGENNALIEAAPSQKKGYISVPAVFE